MKNRNYKKKLNRQSKIYNEKKKKKKKIIDSSNIMEDNAN